MTSVWAPLHRYDGLPWDIYLYLFWERARERGLTQDLNYTKRCMVESALARCAKDRAEQYLRDWSKRTWGYHRESIVIKMFVPGKHYHVLGHRFATYHEAADYARARGYKPNGLEKHVIRLDGD
jgi:hypothetical protein